MYGMPRVYTAVWPMPTPSRLMKKMASTMVVILEWIRCSTCPVSSSQRLFLDKANKVREHDANERQRRF